MELRAQVYRLKGAKEEALQDLNQAIALSRDQDLLALVLPPFLSINELGGTERGGIGVYSEGIGIAGERRRGSGV